MSFFHSLAEFFKEGGWTMGITATVGLVGFAFAVERGYALYRKYAANNALFMARIKELILQKRFEDAIQYCNTEKKSLLPRVVKSGIERLGCDEKIVRQSMESTYLENVPKITERVGYLSMLANAGLLFGLFGTVLGLINQFAALASSEVADKQLLMAKGISEAMNNTALGLGVALPLLVLHGIMQARSNKLLEDLEVGSSQFLDWVGLYNYGQLEARLTDPSNILPIKGNKRDRPAA